MRGNFYILFVFELIAAKKYFVKKKLDLIACATKSCFIVIALNSFTNIITVIFYTWNRQVNHRLCKDRTLSAILQIYFQVYL